MGAQASPSGVPYAGTEEDHEPVDIVILVVKSQPRGCRLKAVSQFLSGDAVPALEARLPSEFWSFTAPCAIPRA